MTLRAADAATLEVRIEGMSCGSCVRRVERALGGASGVNLVTVNLATEIATVTLTPLTNRATIRAELAQVVESAGYRVLGLARRVPPTPPTASKSPPTACASAMSCWSCPESGSLPTRSSSTVLGTSTSR